MSAGNMGLADMGYSRLKYHPSQYEEHAMPPRGFTSQLSDENRGELDKKLRASGYGDLVELAAWLETTLGVKSSKSALGRYALDLKTKDRATSMIARDMRDDLTSREAVDLMVELGALRVKEHRILKRLEEIGFM